MNGTYYRFHHLNHFHSFKGNETQFVYEDFAINGESSTLPCYLESWTTDVFNLEWFYIDHGEETVRLFAYSSSEVVDIQSSRRITIDNNNSLVISPTILADEGMYLCHVCIHREHKCFDFITFLHVVGKYRLCSILFTDTIVMIMCTHLLQSVWQLGEQKSCPAEQE